MAWTQDDLDAIKEAIASGAKRVKFQTHEVEYQSIDQMAKAKSFIETELGLAQTSGGAIFAEYESGV